MTAYQLPTVSPVGSLGFKYGNPLDGSNCYLRLVEAIMKSKRVRYDELDLAMLSPLEAQLGIDADQLHDNERRDWFFCTRNSFNAVDTFMAAVVAFERTSCRPASDCQLAGKIVVLDSFHLPWHSLYQKRHSAMHDVYVRRLFEDGRAQVLDTDADATSFLRTVSVDVLLAAATKVGTFEYLANWRSDVSGRVRSMILQSKRQIATDCRNLRLYLADPPTIDDLDLCASIYMTSHILLAPQFLLWHRICRRALGVDTSYFSASAHSLSRAIGNVSRLHRTVQRQRANLDQLQRACLSLVNLISSMYGEPMHEALDQVDHAIRVNPNCLQSGRGNAG